MTRSFLNRLGVLGVVAVLFGSLLQTANGIPPSDGGSSQPGRIDAREQRPSDRSFDEAEAIASSDSGMVRVIAGLRMLFEPEGRMSATSQRDQHRTIAAGQQAVRDDLAGTHYRVTHAYTTVPYIALALDKRGVQALRDSDSVSSLQIDRPEPPVLAQSVPLIGATDMFNAGFTGAGQTVAILDTGVDRNHSFFGNRVVEEACFSNAGGAGPGTSTCPNGQPTQTGVGSGINCSAAVDGCFHGTHVAGIAAGNGSSFSGVAKAANIMSVQVFTRFESPADCGSQPAPCALSFPSDVLAGLQRVFAVRSLRPISSVNMSLGGGRSFTNCDGDALKAAIDNLLSAGIATAIASGNDGFSDSVNTPACISTAVTVGSSTKDDQVSSFSNGHPTIVDLLAPGSEITSSVPGGGFAVLSGTSIAAPHVAGAFALLRSRFPTATIAQILSALRMTGVPLTDARSVTSFTTPRIKVFDAATVLGGGPVPTPPPGPTPTPPPIPTPGTMFTVSFTVFGPGVVTGVGINCGKFSPVGDCSEAYAAGTLPSFTALRFRKAVFKGWGGDFGTCARSAICTINGIQGNFNASALFKKKRRR